jgi:dihydropteroate synthase
MSGEERRWRGLTGNDQPRAPLPAMRWKGHELHWGAETHVMAILNITPDSFSGDGLGEDSNAVADAALTAVAEGARILDLGAESTRPGHVPISAEEELRRLLPALATTRSRTDAIISVDTSKAAVAAAALRSGADMINDIRGFTVDPEIADVVASAGVPAVIMHDIAPEPGVDLMTSVLRELSRRLDRAVAGGVAWELIIVDPGFGFGKAGEHWRQNFELLRRLGELRALGRPILAGTSRKSMIGRVLGVPEDDRIEGTAATVSLAVAAGADVVRVHDVRQMARVTRMTDAVVRGAPREMRTWPAVPPD